jgi:hypothetical protein
VRVTPPTTEAGAPPVFAVPPRTSSDRVDALDATDALVLRDLTERVTDYRSTNADRTGNNPTETDFAEVRLDIFAASGDLLGHTAGAGRMLYRDADGHFIAYFGEEITLLDGTVIRSGGLVDDARLTAGEPATFPAAVIAGPLRGAIGFRQFRPVGSDAHDTYESSIVVYRP